MGMSYYSSGGIGRRTETADVRIQTLLGGLAWVFTHLVDLHVTTGIVEHTLTAMRASSNTTIASGSAVTGDTLTLDGPLTDWDGDDAEADDLVAIKWSDGTWFLATIAVYDPDALTIQLTADIGTEHALAAGAMVVMYGVPDDTVHLDYQYTLFVSTTNELPNNGIDGGSLVRGTALGEPLLLDIDNPTDASVLEYARFGGTKT